MSTYGSTQKRSQEELRMTKDNGGQYIQPIVDFCLAQILVVEECIHKLQHSEVFGCALGLQWIFQGFLELYSYPPVL